MSGERLSTETAQIEKALKDHALIGERYLREKDSTADVCTCGTLHPKFADGRWPTHRRHVAEQVAALVLPPGQADPS